MWQGSDAVLQSCLVSYSSNSAHPAVVPCTHASQVDVRATHNLRHSCRLSWLLSSLQIECAGHAWAGRHTRHTPCRLAVCKTAMNESSEPAWGSCARWCKTFRVASGSAVALPSTSSPVMKRSASAVQSPWFTSFCLHVNVQCYCSLHRVVVIMRTCQLTAEDVMVSQCVQP